MLIKQKSIDFSKKYDVFYSSSNEWTISEIWIKPSGYVYKVTTVDRDNNYLRECKLIIQNKGIEQKTS